jgi:hypothetical protein
MQLNKPRIRNPKPSEGFHDDDIHFTAVVNEYKNFDDTISSSQSLLLHLSKKNQGFGDKLACIRK